MATAALNPKAGAYHDALPGVGIDMTEQETREFDGINGPISQQLEHGWAKCPGNTGQRQTAQVAEKLNKLYMLGKSRKKRRVSAERALQILHTELIYDDWVQQIMTVPRITAFFQLTPSKQKTLIVKLRSEQGEVQDDDFDVQVAEVERLQAQNERVGAAAVLIDLQYLSYMQTCRKKYLTFILAQLAISSRGGRFRS